LTVATSGELIASGSFSAAGGALASNVARWTGSAWSALVPGTDMRIDGIRTLANGDLVAFGHFTQIAGISALRIARFDGSTWTPLGGGCNSPVLAVTELANGDLVAGGVFTTAGGVAASRIARWDGSAWSTLGSGIQGAVRALVALPNGDVVAAGEFVAAGGAPAMLIARWDGASWSPLGAGLGPVSPSTAAYALLALPGGDLLVGGTFTTAGGATANRIARWNGTSWSPLGTGMQGATLFVPSVNALTLLPNGDVLAAGDFLSAGGTSASYIARWDGGSWSALPGAPAPLRAVLRLPDGDLLAGGYGPGSPAARWDGAAWTSVGTFDGPVLQMAVRAHGDVAFAGDFLSVDGTVSTYLAHLSTTCPATATTVGSACVGAGGINTLTAVTLPWTGATSRSLATGLAPGSLVVVVRGFAAISVALSALLPQGVPGCMLYCSPDVLDLMVPVAGEAALQFDVPNVAALVGTVLYEQVVPFELGAAGITAVTGSNALRLQVGAF
jgi:hypothetical protein